MHLYKYIYIPTVNSFEINSSIRPRRDKFTLRKWEIFGDRIREIVISTIVSEVIVRPREQSSITGWKRNNARFTKLTLAPLSNRIIKSCFIKIHRLSSDRFWKVENLAFCITRCINGLSTSLQSFDFSFERNQRGTNRRRILLELPSEANWCERSLLVCHHAISCYYRKKTRIVRIVARC